MSARKRKKEGKGKEKGRTAARRKLAGDDHFPAALRGSVSVQNVCREEAVVVCVLVGGGETQGVVRVRDRLRTRRTAEGSSHDGEAAEQEEGGGDVPEDGRSPLDTHGCSPEAEEAKGDGDLARTTTASGGLRRKKPSD